MPGSTVGITLGLGFAGTVGRTPDILIKNKPVASDSDAIPFGKGVILKTDNTVTAVDSTLTAANFAGVAIAEVKQNNTYNASNGTGAGEYAPDSPCDYLSRGTIIVKVGRGTPTAGGAVYLRKATSTALPNAEVGDFEAASDGSNSVQLTNCCWETGVMDANNNCELRIKSINN